MVWKTHQYFNYWRIFSNILKNASAEYFIIILLNVYILHKFFYWIPRKQEEIEKFTTNMYETVEEKCSYNSITTFFLQRLVCKLFVLEWRHVSARTSCLARPRAVPAEYVIPSAGRHVSLFNHMYIYTFFTKFADFIECGRNKQGAGTFTGVSCTSRDHYHQWKLTIGLIVWPLAGFTVHKIKYSVLSRNLVFIRRRHSFRSTSVMRIVSKVVTDRMFSMHIMYRYDQHNIY